MHAGSGIGQGHLTRSLVAARSLVTALGANVDFVAVGQRVDERLARDFQVNFSVTDGSIDLVADQLTKRNDYDAICLDLFKPLLVANLGVVLRSARKKGCKVVAIDSLVGCEQLIDLLYVPSFIPPFLPEGSDFRGRLAHGWDAYLLNVHAKNKKPDPSGSILALTGGSDATQLGQYWPAVLDLCLPLGYVVHWVTGPLSERPIFPDPSRVEFIEHVAPAGLSALMHEVTAAVTVFGVSFFELIALGVPTVVFSPYGETDYGEMQAIADQRIALVAQDAKDAAEQAAVLAKDSSLRAELANNARGKLKKYDGEYFAAEVELVLASQI